MRLTLSVYVSVDREAGRSVYVCQPLRGPQLTTRDPLLSTALSKLGSKMRKAINEWIESGQAGKVNPWYYDPEITSKSVKLTLVLRDRTLRWKILLATLPAFGRHIAFSPSIPDVPFEVDSLVDLEMRAIEVFSAWAQARISAGEESATEEIGDRGDMWIEPLEVDVETAIRGKKKSKNILADLFGDGKTSGSDELHKVGQCQDDLAADFEPALGRTELVDDIDRLLQRHDRQGVLVVGPPAVGKTAILQECIRRRMERFRDRRGHKPQVWWLSPQRLISGMSYLGQWEQRWLAILREATKRDHVLYFDDLVGLFTAGRTRDSSLSAADVLRSHLSEHRVRIVAESTAEQLAILRRRDRALADRFHLVHVPTLSADDALPTVLEATYNIEARSARFFHPETIPLMMRHQEIFAPDQAFPGKAIEMSKALAKHASEVVELRTVYRLAGTQVGASLTFLLNRLGNQESIQKLLGQQLIGQPVAVAALSRIVVRYSQHLQPPDRPLGVLLLLGPTGVGKTEAAKALTRLLFTDEAHLVRLDMNELTTPLAAEQLVGTFDQPEGRLTSAVRRQPNCVILLDEIEKAHPDVFDYLLQVLGEGRLTDARGRVADFRSSIIIMTSNLGASRQDSSLGFDITAERRSQIYTRAAQQFFRPEFFNRIDEVVAFRNLDPSDMEKIVRIQLDQVLARDGIKRRHVFVHVAPAAIKKVIQTGFDARLGARAVRRMLEREVIGPLGDCLSDMQVDKPALVQITHREDAPQLSCDVNQLEMAPRRRQVRLSDLEQLVEVGKELYQRLDLRLGELAQPLRQIDEELGEKNHNLSYYALREQVYRCSELLKTSQFRLRQRDEPRLDHSSPVPSKLRRDTDGVASKRMMRDWLAQEDLRSAISDQRLGTSTDQLSSKELARQLVDHFTIASAMIESALAPRHWLIGFQPLTGKAEFTDGGETEREFKNALAGDQDILAGIAEPLDFQSHLISCLQSGWQYEVSASLLGGQFHRVAGVSLLGIVGPLLGTYQTERPSHASHLLVLRAVPIPAGATHEEMNQRLLQSTLAGPDGELRTPREHPLPTKCIRGVIGNKTIDFVSGAVAELPTEAWYRSDRALARNMRWWTECLPVPTELLAK